VPEYQDTTPLRRGFCLLRHDHFMAKVPKVLGETAPKFFGTDQYTKGNGAVQSRPIYTFPKREACLMAMSYSYGQKQTFSS
jgi:hypothetical protein